MPTPASVLPPPLCEGDRLSSDEFLRRWEAMPELKHAELIDGIVYMASPVSDIHGLYHFRVSSWFAFYLLATPGCEAVADVTTKMAEDGVPQPDLALRVMSEYGGQSSLEGAYSKGAPELVVEVSVSSEAKDTGAKLRLYERSGVREYVIVQPAKEQVTWRQLSRGKYREIKPDVDGLLRSSIFPGLWLNPAALWKGDLPGLAATVQQGVASDEHAAFVRELSGRKR